MALTDYKITETERDTLGITTADNQYINKAGEIKARFDALPKTIVNKYNQALDALAVDIEELQQDVSGNPTINQASTITNVTLSINMIYKIPGAKVYKIYGQFSSASDGIPSGGGVANGIPSAYRPAAAFDTWAFAQKNDGTVLRATATIQTNGSIKITTQNSTSFRYFRIDAIIPNGL